MIWDPWWDGDHNVWKIQQINRAGGQTPSAPPAVGGPFVSVYNNQQHFAYPDSFGTIWDSWWDGDNAIWNLQQINTGGWQSRCEPPQTAREILCIPLQSNLVCAWTLKT